MQINRNTHINLKSYVNSALTPDHLAGKITNLFFAIYAGYHVVGYVYRKFIATPLPTIDLSSTEKIEIEKLIHTRTPDSLQKAFDKLKDKYDYNLWEKLLLNLLIVNSQDFLSCFNTCPVEHKLEISKKAVVVANLVDNEELGFFLLEKMVSFELCSSRVKDVSKVSQLINKYDDYRSQKKKTAVFESLFNEYKNPQEGSSPLKEIIKFLRLEWKLLEETEKELYSIKETIKGTAVYSKIERIITAIEENKIKLKIIFNSGKHEKSDLLENFINDYQFFDTCCDPTQFYKKAREVAHKLPQTNEQEAKEKLESYLKITEVLRKNDEIDDDLGDEVGKLCECIKEKDYALNMVGYFAELSNVFKADDFDETKSQEGLLNLASEVVINAQVFCSNKQLESCVRLSEAIYENGNMCSVLNSILLKIKENYQFLQPKNKEELKEKIRLLCRYLRVYNSFDPSPTETITTFYNHVTSDKFFKDLSGVEQIEVGLQTLDIFFGNYDIKNSFLRNNSCLELALPIFNSIKKLPQKTFTECQVKMQFMQKIFLLDLQFSLNISSIEQFHEDMLALAASVPTIKDQLDLYGDLVNFYVKNKNKKHLEEKFDHLNFNCEERAGEVFLRASEITSSSTFKDLSPREKVRHLEKLAELREIISIELCFESKVITPSALIEEAFKEAKNIEDPKVEKPLPQSLLSRLSFGPSYVEAKCIVYLRLAKKMNILWMDIKDVVTAISEIQYKAERVDSEVFHLCRAVEELDKITEDENKETLQKPLLEKVEVRLKEAVEKAITLTEIERVLDGYKTFRNTLIELAPELSVFDPDAPYESYGTLPFGSIFKALNNLPQENIAKITELKSKAILLSPEANRFGGLLNEVIEHQPKTIQDVKSKYKALSTLFAVCFDINWLDFFLQSWLFTDSYFQGISSKYETEKMKELLLTIPKTFKEKMSCGKYYVSNLTDRTCDVSNLFKRFEKLNLTPLEFTEAYLAFAENIEIWATFDQLLEILKKIQVNIMLIDPGKEFKNLMEKVNRIEIQLDLLKQNERGSLATRSFIEEESQDTLSIENDSFAITNSPLLREKLKISDEVISWNKVKSAAIRFIALWALARIMAKTTINLGCRFFTIINGTSVSGYERLVGLYTR